MSSAWQEQQPATPAGVSAETENGNSKPQDEQQQDVWAELFGVVQGLAETVGLALQAFTPSDDKAVSAITKKRLALRSLQGLKQGQSDIETLLEHLKALQAASRTWQRSMIFASKSHQELMEQVETTTAELHATNERLRAIEAQRIAAVRDAESLRGRSAQQEALIKEMQSQLKQREEELETLQFMAHEAQASAAEARRELERLAQAATAADGRAHAAAASIEEAKAEAAKAQGLAERHQQVVAKLTADNLVFLMQLKKAEADLAAANQERAQLRLAAEKQRGPWFDQVRAGVEERVREALQRSQELEMQIDHMRSEHASEMEAAQAEKMRLEEELEATRRHAEGLQGRLVSSTEQQQRAEGLSAAAEAAARELKQRLDDLAAENRVLQESVRAMRQECTERWVSEQAALGQVGGLEERVQELERLLAAQTAQAAGLQRQLDNQTGVNRQLMARKEEVEWQLMAAMAKLDGGATDGPVPLNLQVSGLLQVGGSGGAGQQPNRASSGGGAADVRTLVTGGATGLSPGTAPTPSRPPPPPPATGMMAAASEAQAGALGQAASAQQGVQRGVGVGSGQGSGQGAPAGSRVGVDGDSSTRSRVIEVSAGLVPQPLSAAPASARPLVGEAAPPARVAAAVEPGAAPIRISTGPSANGVAPQRALAAGLHGQGPAPRLEDGAQKHGHYQHQHHDHLEQQQQHQQPSALPPYTGGGGEQPPNGHAATLGDTLQPEPTLMLPGPEASDSPADHSSHHQGVGSAGSSSQPGDPVPERDPTEKRQQHEGQAARLAGFGTDAGPSAAPQGAAYRGAPGGAGRAPAGPPGPREGAASSGAGVGVGPGVAIGGEGPPRWPSVEGEGASTVFSSPPSSVALSTEPGSMQELSCVPSATSSAMDPGPAAPTTAAAAAAAAAVTIRTVSTGRPRPQRPPQEAGAGGSIAAEGDGDGEEQERVVRQVAPSYPARGGENAAGGAAGQDGPWQGAAYEPLARRGSLHEGGDVWFADDASSTSSDDSDFFFAGGVVLHRGVAGGGAGGANPSQPSPHQALLHQLQQQLQAHLQAPPPPRQEAEAGAVGVQGQLGGLAGHARLSSSVAAGLPWEMAGSIKAPNTQVDAPQAARDGARDDGDVIQVRPGHRQAVEQGGNAGGGRPTIGIRTSPMLPGVGRTTGDGPSARALDLAFDSMYGRNDPAGGVLSIVKGSGFGGGLSATRAGASGSPVHPAFRGAAAPTSAASAGGGGDGGGSPFSSPQSQAGAAAAGDGAGGQGRRTAAAVIVTQQAPPAGSSGSARTAAAPPAGHSEPAIPSRVQAGPPFYATAGPVHGSSVTAFEHWSSEGGGQVPQPQVIASQPRPAPLETSMPPSSPTWSTATRSPRSPTHPAMYVPGELRTETTAGHGFSAQGAGGGRAEAARTAAAAAAQQSRDAGVRMAASGLVWPSQQGGVVGLARTGRGDELDGGAMGSDTPTPPTAAAAAAAVVSAAGRAAAVARPRVSFHGLSQPGAAAPDDPNDGPGLSYGRVSSFSSSNGSSLHGNTGPASGSAGLQPHKSGSVKSVRFSDHDADEDTPRQQRGAYDYGGATAAMRSNLRASTPFSGHDSQARPQVNRGGARYEGHPGASPPSQPYRSQGPVPHPAIIAAIPLGTSASGTDASAGGRDAGGFAPSSRISAAGVAVTTMPRGPAASSS